MRKVVILVASLSAFACGDPPAPPEVPRAPRAEPSSPPETAPAPTAAPLEAALLAHARFLTSDELAGRYAGSAGERAAADYIAKTLDGLEVGPYPPDRRFHVFEASGGWWKSRSPESRNVLGHLAGADPALASELVIVGAHYDHLGEKEGHVYRGADDNASGVAVTLEIARALAERRADLGRSVLLVFFGAEEVGLLGSRAFVGEAPPRAERPVGPPLLPVASIASMVNLDMVGRPLVDHVAARIPLAAMGLDPERSLGVIGLQGRPAVRAMVDRAFSTEDIRVMGTDELPAGIRQFIEIQSDGRGDSFPFERAGVPSLFFSSGSHADYHEPSDEVELLRMDLMAARVRAVTELVVLLSRAPRSDLPRSSGSPFAATPDDQTPSPEAAR